MQNQFLFLYNTGKIPSFDFKHKVKYPILFFYGRSIYHLNIHNLNKEIQRIFFCLQTRIEGSIQNILLMLVLLA